MSDVKPADRLIPSEELRIKEVISKRTTNTKTFRTGPTKYKLVVALGGNVHYKDNPHDENELFKEVDLAVKSNGKCDRAPYKVEVYKAKVGYHFEARTGGRVTVELIEVGGLPVDNKRFKTKRNGNMFFWDNVADDIDMKIELQDSNVEIFKALKSENAPRQLKWLVREDTDNTCHFVRKTLGEDSFAGKPQRMEINTAVTNEIIGVELGKEYREFEYEEIWTGRVGKTTVMATRRKEWSSEVVYPAIIDATTTLDIAANNDDGHASKFSTYSNPKGTNWEAGNCKWGEYTYFGSKTWDFYAGLRFLSVPITKDYLVNSAGLQIYLTGKHGSTSCKIYGDDVDSGAAWSNSSNPKESFTKTTGVYTWAPTTTGAFITAAVTSIVQELVDRAGWVKNNNMRFGFFHNNPGGAWNTAQVHDRNSSSGNAANLILDYETPPSSGIKTSLALTGVGN